MPPLRFNSRADALVGSAAADVPGHRLINILVGGHGFALQQRHRLHDLPGLAVAALGYVDLDPCSLDRMQPVLREPFDSGNFLAGRIAHGNDAGADGISVLENRAGATKRHTAPELCARQAQKVAEVPQDRHLGIAIEGAFNSIDFELDHGFASHRLW